MIVFNSYNLTEFNSLFEIPIYRLDPTSFENELKRELDRISNPLTMFENDFRKNAKEKYKANRQAIERHISYSWKFNEIIGWVLLNIDREIFSGELFYKEGKRIAKGSKSKINFKCEAFRFDITNEMSNLDIYASILAELKDITKKTVKGRYIDTNRFETVGKYIDRRKMFTELNG